MITILNTRCNTMKIDEFSLVGILKEKGEVENIFIKKSDLNKEQSKLYDDFFMMFLSKEFVTIQNHINIIGIDRMTSEATKTEKIDLKYDELSESDKKKIDNFLMMISNQIKK